MAFQVRLPIGMSRARRMEASAKRSATLMTRPCGCWSARAGHSDGGVGNLGELDAGRFDPVNKLDRSTTYDGGVFGQSHKSSTNIHTGKPGGHSHHSREWPIDPCLYRFDDSGDQSHAGHEDLHTRYEDRIQNRTRYLRPQHPRIDQEKGS